MIFNVWDEKSNGGSGRRRRNCTFSLEPDVLRLMHPTDRGWKINFTRFASWPLSHSSFFPLHGLLSQPSLSGFALMIIPLQSNIYIERVCRKLNLSPYALSFSLARRWSLTNRKWCGFFINVLLKAQWAKLKSKMFSFAKDDQICLFLFRKAFNC